jgi:hypothetical protein
VIPERYLDMTTLYAKNLVQQSALCTATYMVGAWEHLAYREAKNPDEMNRAQEMAHLWASVVTALAQRIAKKPVVFNLTLVPANKIIEVVDALVLHKSEIAYKVDHG